MRVLLTLMACVTTTAYAAPVATPINPVPDLNQDQIQQQQQQEPMLPEKDQSTHSVSMSSQELLQHPDLLNNALDTANAQHDIDTIRFLLPIYEQLPAQEQNSTMLNYAQALVLREDNQHAKAEEKLQKIMDEYPDYAPVRLQLAITQSQDGKTREAQKNLTLLQQTPDLPPHIHEVMNQFDQYLQKERKWQFSGTAYYLQEDNVARTPQTRHYGNWTFAEPQSAHGLGYEASIQKTIPIQGHWATRFNLAAYGKFYWDAHDYDDLILRAEPSLIWRNAKQEISFAPYYEKRWFGTDAYSATTGGITRFSRIINPKWQVFGAWQSGYKRYDERDFLDGATHTASLSAVYQPSSKQYFVFGIGGGRENAKDLSEAYTQSNLRLAWSRDWGKQQQFNSIIQANVQKRYYRAPDFFNIQRRDTEYFTRLILSHKKFSWKGFTPRLNWTWSHVDSNHFYYRHQQNRIFMDISKQF